MTRLRNATAAVAALLGPLLLAGCGIKPTGVVESGTAATVVINSPDRAGLVYFVTPDDKLVPSPQLESPSSSAVAILLRLLNGPGTQERAAGLGTRLPALDDSRAGAVDATFTAPGNLEVRVPFKVDGLSRLAHRQVVCSVTSATAGDSTAVRVTLRGPDAVVFEEPCDIGR